VEVSCRGWISTTEEGKKMRRRACRMAMRGAVPGGAAVGLTLVVLTAGCAAPVPNVDMEVSAPGTARVGENARVRVLFENLPREGCEIEMEFHGFGPDGPPLEIVLEMPPLDGASGDRKKLGLLWENSNGSILGALADMPHIPSGPGSPFEFPFEALSAGTTEIALTMTGADGNMIERTVTVVVVE
jgi:hypothetical protein